MILKEIPNEDVGRYYWMRVHCLNCGFSGDVAITKGEQVIDQKCPDCECKTILKGGEL